MGLGTSTTSELSMLIETGRREESRDILKNVFWFILIFGSIPFILMMCSLFIIPWYDILGLKEIQIVEFNLTFLILILYIYLNLFLTLPLGYYRAVKIYHRERYISAIFRATEFTTMLIIVLLGHGVLAVAIGYFLNRILNLVFVLYDLHQRHEDFRLFPFGFKFSRIKHLLKPALSTLVIYLGQNLMVQGITTLIGIRLGSLEVVIFNTTRTLASFVKNLVGIVNLTYVSEFSYAYGKSNIKELLYHFLNAQRINLLISFSALLGLYFMGGFIMTIWTGGRVSIIEPFFTFLLIGVFLNNIWNLGMSLLIAINKQSNIGGVFLILSLVSLTIIYVGIDTYQLSIVALSIILFETGMLIWIYRYCMNLLDLNFNQLFILRLKNN